VLREGSLRSFIIEVKHWRSGQRVGPGAVSKFLKVVVREKRAGGLFLSTYGYADTAFEALSQVDQQRLRFGDREKILGLCMTYLRMESGLWIASQPLPELLFEATRANPATTFVTPVYT
jgi:restriction system protein